ncbi:MarR family winged helix-turn-helix transcriptional regulator [Microbulbifer yueqingensis]|uniref:DNA-binding transcriptional regulator, MarR family n=1 Tax=Microbulbifer yueqingensis TaxID=658219 RepID=A0A1G9CK93_9GAMM|nr:MarR family transcriptional regulator [Microbulbifer yueqingensis]SDK52111.1 DNA-binding transcriptional regulator, MarR family [Microbulbifer yueqingensis]
MSKDRLRKQGTALYHALSHLVRVYQSRDREHICCYDISITQCNLLEVLLDHGAMRPLNLAQHLMLDKSTTSRVAETLVKKNYVARTPDPTDGRAQLIDLTENGRELVLKIRDELIEEEMAILRDLPKSVQDEAPGLLIRLAKAAQKRTSCCG